MTAVNRTSLYAYFTTGAKPTQSQFDDLIDSCLNLATASAQSIQSDLGITGIVTVAAGEVIGAPTGGYKGTGTLNVQTGLYINGTLVTVGSAAGSGTVNIGVSGQIAFYPMDSNTVGGTNTLPSGTMAKDLKFTTTTGLIGTTTNDNAAIGSVGEYINSAVLAGAPLSILTNVQTNLTSIALTAGDWDVYSETHCVPSNGNFISLIYSSISLNSAILATTFGFNTWGSGPAGTGFTGDGSSILSAPNGASRISVSANTTVYLVANHNAVSPVGFYGGLWARRAR